MKKKIKKKIKKLKAYHYDTFEKARIRGYTKQQWINSNIAKKRWDNLSDLKKEIILENLEKGKERRKGKNFIYAYEISSQSHYSFRNKKVKSEFEYTLKGYFANIPHEETLEKISKNSLISAFNSGKTGQKKYLKNSVFNKLVNEQVRGFKIEKVKIHKSQLTNKAEAELIIINNGNKWKGNN